MSTTWDVTELSDDQLRHSDTWVRYEGVTGVCTKCQEHTSILNPCCGESVSFEGGTINPADVWDKIDQEMRSYYEPDEDLAYEAWKEQQMENDHEK